MFAGDGTFEQLRQRGTRAGDDVLAPAGQTVAAPARAGADALQVFPGGIDYSE